MQHVLVLAQAIKMSGFDEIIKEYHREYKNIVYKVPNEEKGEKGIELHYWKNNQVVMYEITEFDLPNNKAFPSFITQGSDGALWLPRIRAIQSVE